jgi:hypothetical protein
LEFDGQNQTLTIIGWSKMDFFFFFLVRPFAALSLFEAVALLGGFFSGRSSSDPSIIL